MLLLDLLFAISVVLFSVTVPTPTHAFELATLSSSYSKTLAIAQVITPKIFPGPAAKVFEIGLSLLDVFGFGSKSSGNTMHSNT